MSFGTYIHVPFCKSKCPYCDFYSLLLRDEDTKDRYVEAVIKEITAFSEFFGNEKEQEHSFIEQAPDSIYFGGGTPSLLSPDQVSKILSALDNTFGKEADREVTLEANPKTVDEEYLKQIRTDGVNRLSIGIQSFDDGILKKLGRTHKAEDSKKAFEHQQQECEATGICRL